MRTMFRKVAVGGVAAGMAISALGAGDTLVLDGSTTVGPIAKAFAEYYMSKNPSVNITVSESGSGNGAKSLLNATCDIATMSRPMKESEKKGAQDAGILPIANVVAMDGLAVVVHPSNPVKALSLQQVRDIYTGKTDNWQALGGPDRKIVVVSRDTNSGTYESFETLVMKGEKLAGRAEYVGSNGAVRQRVMSTDAAIGYVGLAFTESVKVLAIEGVLPSAESVLDKTYAVARPLYMYTNGKPKAGTHLANFIGLCATPEGRKMVEETGYVPLE